MFCQYLVVLTSNVMTILCRRRIPNFVHFCCVLWSIISAPN